MFCSAQFRGAGTVRKKLYSGWQLLFWLGLSGFCVITASGCSAFTPVAGLAPEYPSLSFFGSFVRVDSLQPTLRWESFPQDGDLQHDSQGLLKGIRDVTYDLRIWRSEEDEYYPDGYPAELVYARDGLPDHTHRIEQHLKPETKYFWTVRARFQLGGHTRVTHWGVGWRHEAPGAPWIPINLYYRFETSD